MRSDHEASLFSNLLRDDWKDIGRISIATLVLLVLKNNQYRHLILIGLDFSWGNRKWNSNWFNTKVLTFVTALVIVNAMSAVGVI